MPRNPLFVGEPALVVVDIQRGSDMPAEVVGIEHAALDAMEYLQAGARRTSAEIIDGFAALREPRMAGASR